MAEVSRGRPNATGTDGPVPDPRTLRITLVPELRHDDDRAATVAPAAVPIRPRPDDLTAVGPLGGVAIVANEEAGAGTSSPEPAPQVLLVNGDATTVRLDRRDPEHAIIELDDADLPVPMTVPVARVFTSDTSVGGDASAVAETAADRAQDQGDGRGSRAAVGQPVRRRVILGASSRRPADGILVQEVIVDGWRFELEVESERRAALRERARRGHEAAGHAGPLEIRAIIPGRIVAISVGPGDAVEAGQQLLVLEAMKMQNELRSPREGEIERIAVSIGETVEVGNLLMVIS